MGDKNRDIDVPTFDVGETGRVDLTLYKMDTGFLLRDNTLGKDHSISKIEDLEASLSLVIESVKEKIRELMRERDKFDYIDIGVVVQEGEDAGEQYDISEMNEPETLNLEPDQLADLINSIYSNNPMGGFPQRGGHRGPVVVTGQDVVRAMNSPRNVIRMKTRIGDTKHKADKTENLHFGKDKKKFYSDKTKNELKEKGGQDKSKPTEIN